MEYEPGIGGGSTLPCSDRMQGVSCAYNVRGPCRPLKTGFSAPYLWGAGDGILGFLPVFFIVRFFLVREERDVGCTNHHGHHRLRLNSKDLGIRSLQFSSML
jgi:hypothetical protein